MFPTPDHTEAIAVIRDMLRDTLSVVRSISAESGSFSLGHADRLTRVEAGLATLDSMLSDRDERVASMARMLSAIEAKNPTP